MKLSVNGFVILTLIAISPQACNKKEDSKQISHSHPTAAESENAPNQETSSLEFTNDLNTSDVDPQKTVPSTTDPVIQSEGKIEIGYNLQNFQGINDAEAVNIASEELIKTGRNPIVSGTTGAPIVTREEGFIQVLWPFIPPTPTSNGPDYTYRVRINPDTKQVEQFLFGS